MPIVTRDFFRFVETASVAELMIRRGKLEQARDEFAKMKAADYVAETRIAISIIDEQIAAKAEAAIMSPRR